jgi:restriction endonuclease S subunit
MNWLPMTVGNLLTLEYGKALPRSIRIETGAIPVAGSNGSDGFHNAGLVQGPGIVVGRKGSAGKVTWYESDFWPIDTTYFVQHDPQITNLRWLYYLLQAKKLERLNKTTGVPGLNRKDVYAEAILLPPLKEQSRIVELLDEANRICDLRREADAKVARILPAIFKQLFGQPETWRHTETLGHLVAIKSGGTPSKSVPEFWRGPIPWVSPKDMKRDEIDDAEDHISEAAIKASAAPLLSADAVLIVVRGMILARTVPIAITLQPVSINQDMKALILTDKRINSRFLYAALRVQSTRLLAEVTTAAHGTKKLESTRLENLPIPIPSTSSLAKFSSSYEQLLSVDRLQSITRSRIDSIFALLMQRAFSGQLTAKWREANIQELLVEMEQQVLALNRSIPNKMEASS